MIRSIGELTAGVSVLAALIAAIFASSQVSAQMSKEEFVEVLAQAGQPVAQHKALELFAGDWVTDAKFYFIEEPLLVAGTAHGEMILGGRFVEFRTEATEGDMPTLQTLTLIGFDTRSYEFFWLGVDTFGTYSVTFYGGFDVEERLFTFEGEFTDQGITSTTRITIWFEDDNTMEQQVFGENPMVPGERMKIAEAVYTRSEG